MSLSIITPQGPTIPQSRTITLGAPISLSLAIQLGLAMPLGFTVPLSLTIPLIPASQSYNNRVKSWNAVNSSIPLGPTILLSLGFALDPTMPINPAWFNSPVK